MTAIAIEGLCKRFHRRPGWKDVLRWRRPEAIQALDGLDLCVGEGELVALIGPNGAGKTTLLEILAQLVAPDRGRITILGHPLVDRARLRSQVGYVVSEERSFFLRLSVMANLRFFAELEAVQNPRQRIQEVAAWMGLEDLLHQRFSTLSAGQKQRASIARGLLNDPPILLFDEATRALDPGRAHRFRRLVRSVLIEQRGKTVLYATHVLEEAASLADRVAVLSKGQLCALGPWAEVAPKATALFASEAAAEDEALEALLGALR